MEKIDFNFYGFRFIWQEKPIKAKKLSWAKLQKNIFSTRNGWFEQNVWIEQVLKTLPWGEAERKI